jgi:GNAT superfamily N-acetyltransferase
MLSIPTTKDLMKRFIGKEISERELLDRTSPGAQYEAIYLCSALVLPKHRRRGLARSMLSRAIEEIRKDHPVEFLFCWPFSSEGKALAETVARTSALPLQERPPD